MADAVSSALTNAVLELSSDVKNLTKEVRRQVDANERVAFQATRIANASEETNALALNEVRESRAEKQHIREQLEKIANQLAVLVDNVKDAEAAADDAKDAARELTGKIPLMPAAPKGELDVGETQKTLGKIVYTGWKFLVKAWPALTAGGIFAAITHLIRWLIGK